MSGKKPIVLLFVLLSGVGYVVLAYFTDRTQTYQLLSLYAWLFLVYSFVIYKSPKISLIHLLLAGIILRLLFIGSVPALSDDFYRFIWDGRLWVGGINPFAHIPNYFIQHPELAPAGIDSSLFALLNSQSHYTVYPPLPQYIGLLSVLVFPESITGSIIIMRFFTILAEIGSFWFLIKLLDHCSLDRQKAAIYFLNPLVIIELTGNLHHEAYMIFFLLAAIYFFKKNQELLAAGIIALAVGSKLIPLIFLPVLLFKMRIKRAIFFMLVVSSTILLLFLPLLDFSFLSGMQDSLTLYYQKFEFNAGLYFIAREIGYWKRGFNMIAVIGRDFAIITFILILGYSLLAKIKSIDLLPASQWILMIFLSFALILHPWYITTLIALSCLTRFRYPVIWSFFIFFTYAGYTLTGYIHYNWIYFLEYGILWLVLVYEMSNQATWNFTLKEAP